MKITESKKIFLELRVIITRKSSRTKFKRSRDLISQEFSQYMSIASEETEKRLDMQKTENSDMCHCKIWPRPSYYRNQIGDASVNALQKNLRDVCKSKVFQCILMGYSPYSLSLKN